MDNNRYCNWTAAAKSSKRHKHSLVSSEKNYGQCGSMSNGQIFVHFSKKFVNSFVIQVHTVIFFLPNFVKPYQTGVLLESRKKFCHAWELTEFSIYTPWSEGRRQSSNLISLWSFFHLWSCHVIDTLWSTKILLFLSVSRLPNWKFDRDNFLVIFGGAKQNLSALCTWDLLWWDEIADY